MRARVRVADICLSGLDLPIQVRTRLKKNGLETIGDLAQMKYERHKVGIAKAYACELLAAIGEYFLKVYTYIETDADRGRLP